MSTIVPVTLATSAPITPLHVAPWVSTSDFHDSSRGPGAKLTVTRMTCGAESFEELTAHFFKVKSQFLGILQLE